MKKLAIYIFASGIVLLSGCSKNLEIPFDKKVMCGQEAQKFIQAHAKDFHVDENFYSPVLDTCVVVGDYIMKAPFDSPGMREEFMIDTVSGKTLGGIQYVRDFGFEDPNYLPKVCDRSYSDGEKKLVFEGSPMTFLGPDEPHKSQDPKIELAEIALMEIAYYNCLDYIKGSLSNYSYGEGVTFLSGPDIRAPIIYR